ncbi:TolC family protein [Novispirillum sp. DQ9]|uniref:TolC family protein n=1 Tax=Novispirillum sp. DQ9 TaxID=3398612 RepID=UPI003C7D5407
MKSVSTRRRALSLAGASAIILGLAACTAVPEPLQTAEQQALVAADRAVMFADQQPLSGPVTIEEAIARALKYNLDHRLMVMEEGLRAGQLDVASMDMLPRLTANAGYIVRDKDNVSVSRNTVTGVVSTQPSESQDRERNTADLGLTWNILDFGVSYFSARQQADQVLIAAERRRRVVNQIVQQVRGAYWRAATAERLHAEVVPVIAEARAALRDAQQAESQRLMPPLDSLRYQKALLETLRELEILERDMTIAKSELAALMNLPPGTAYSLALPSAGEMTVPTVTATVEDLENLALLSRPELREEAYQKRISAAETRKALLRLLPGITLNGGVNYDSNSYMLNNQWAEAGARVSWNLMTLLSGPATMRVAEAQQEVGEARRVALAMAVLTQVQVGYQQYLRARQVHEQAQVLNAVEQRIYRHMTADGAAQSPLERIRARVSAITSEVGQTRAYADVQNAAANLFVSVGLSPLPDSVNSHDLPAVQAAVGDVLKRWNSGEVTPVAVAER